MKVKVELIPEPERKELARATRDLIAAMERAGVLPADVGGGKEGEVVQC